MPTPAEKRARFRDLHARGCFVIPNPWDVGSARMLQALGFPAVASTSSGMAWSSGRIDNEVPRRGHSMCFSNRDGIVVKRPCLPPYVR